MMRWALVIGILVTSAEAWAAAPVSVSTACRQLSNGESALTRKCVSHSNYYELKAELVQGCTKLAADTDTRMKCLKSGADAEALRVCRIGKWTVPGTLTCLRAYPTEPLVKACQELSQDEDEQLRCVRLGREATQVEACLEIGFDSTTRLQCLQHDVPQFEARRCAVAEKSAAARMDCLEDFVAHREKDYRNEQGHLRRSIASEGPGKAEEEAHPAPPALPKRRAR